MQTDNNAPHLSPFLLHKRSQVIHNLRLLDILLHQANATNNQQPTSNKQSPFATAEPRNLHRVRSQVNSIQRLALTPATAEMAQPAGKMDSDGESLFVSPRGLGSFRPAPITDQTKASFNNLRNELLNHLDRSSIAYGLVARIPVPSNEGGSPRRCSFIRTTLRRGGSRHDGEEIRGLDEIWREFRRP